MSTTDDLVREATVAAPRPADRVRRVNRRRLLIGLLAVVALLGSAGFAVALGITQREAVPQRELVVNGVPITLYMPGTVPVVPDSTVDLPAPLPPGSRPPGLVLAHGHSADRAMMSWLAGRLAAAGIVVATFDFRGHGTHRAPHEPHGFEGRREDLRTVFDWLRAQPYVDSEHVAIAGHSMGAAAVVHFATHDARPVATVALGGSVATIEGDAEGRNMLFLVAQGDPDAVRDEAVRTAKTLRGGDIRFGDEYGSHGDGSAVGLREVPGNHLTMLYADETAARMADWINRAANGVGPVTTPRDNRLELAQGYLIFMAGLLVLLGALAGALVRRGAGAPGARWRGLALIAGTLLLPLPWLAWGDPGPLVGMEAGGALVVLLAAAGGMLWALCSLAPVRRWCRLDADLAEPLRAAGGRRLLLAALLGTGGTILLLLPLGPLGHGLLPTPTRVVLGLLATLLLLPFFLAADLLVRRGTPLAASGFALAVRLLLLVVTFVAVATGLLPGMIGLYLMLLAPFLVLLELVAGAMYAVGRDPRLPAVFQAGALGWLLAIISPVMW
ncbi:alpha/beta hydrolase [Micromonospora sp. CPCC 206060]|uniref:alpha/beta hydrolase family protein n=1 Tax=Micromonospora sp. CPCC 206060 TaxID=3122406 RepID=UPI002FF406FD